MTTLVCTDVSEATAPTPRIFRNSGQRSRAGRSRARLRPERTYQARTAVPAALNRTIATPPPAIPSAGMGPRPKIRHGESGTSTTTPTQITNAGTTMLPVPRMTLASPFIAHSSTFPANTTFE
jgi:hypothetical protein